MANHATAGTVLCSPLDSLADLDVSLSGEQGMEKLTKGPSYVYLIFPQISQSALVHMICQKKWWKGCTYSIWQLMYAARLPPGYEWCWCHGYRNGCRLIRSLRMHQYHANKEGMLEMKLLPYMVFFCTSVMQLSCLQVGPDSEPESEEGLY